MFPRMRVLLLAVVAVLGVMVVLGVAVVARLVGSPATAAAQTDRVTVVSKAPFAQVAAALERAIGDERMALVCHANAQGGAAARGVTIKGNQVLMVFRNDLAVRLLAADPRAGFEAPIRIYVYETAGGGAVISYVPPSVVFAPYRHPDVQALARELDTIFKAIVDRAVAAR
jgi:uncharacterized protein (DUF302 family)